MQFEENGERIDDLRLILTRVASVSTMFDEDGVQVRFMNTNLDPNSLDGIRSEQQIDQLMRNVSFKGLTPMGTSLRQKVIDGIVIPKLQARRYNKPILVITITDGQPAGEPQNAIHDTIQFAVEQVSRQFGRGAIAFQFAQVGNDLKAREFLSKLDEDPVVGQMIDCTSSKFSTFTFDTSADEYQTSKTNPTKCVARASTSRRNCGWSSSSWAPSILRMTARTNVLVLPAGLQVVIEVLREAMVVRQVTALLQVVSSMEGRPRVDRVVIHLRVGRDMEANRRAMARLLHRRGIKVECGVVGL